MALYYVPFLLVIEADSVDRASTRGNHIIDTVADLQPANLVGVTSPSNMQAQPATATWFDCDQNIVERSDQAVVEEVLL